MIEGFRSPFRFDSYEPRFAIEDCNLASLPHAVEMWKAMTFRRGPITHAASYPNALLLTNAGGHHPGPIHPWKPVALEFEEVVAFVGRWLNDAAVEEPKPNFDGSEVKGFCAFWGYFGGAELPHAYGSFVVTTKWIEIHK